MIFEVISLCFFFCSFSMALPLLFSAQVALILSGTWWYEQKRLTKWPEFWVPKRQGWVWYKHLGKCMVKKGTVAPCSSLQTRGRKRVSSHWGSFRCQRNPEEAYALDEAKSEQRGGNNGWSAYLEDLNANGTCALSMVKAKEAGRPQGSLYPACCGSRRCTHLLCLQDV